MGTIKDIWDITKEIATTITNAAGSLHGQRKQRNDILSRFSPEFLRHPRHITDVHDYYKFVEEESVFKSHTGRILSATHGEVLRLWDRSELIALYEVFLLNHIAMGGEVQRVFVAGPELLIPGAPAAFLKVLHRHHLLGFKPRVASFTDLSSLLRSLGVKCDMFGIISDTTCYFIQFPARESPLLVRSKEPKVKLRATLAHRYLLKSSVSYKTWRSRQSITFSAEEERAVEMQCEMLHNCSVKRL